MSSATIPISQTTNLNPFLGETLVPEYVDAQVSRYYYGYTNLNLPRFTRGWIPDMIRDPRVAFGLWLIKGPVIALGKFKVKCENEDVRSYIKDTIEIFWREAAYACLRCVEWGWSCSEVSFRIDPSTGLTHFARIKSFLSEDCNPIILNDKIIGATVRHVHGNTEGKALLHSPRFIWCIHEETERPYRGISRLRGAFPAFIEKWERTGHRDRRSLWLKKYAFDGGIMYYPQEGTFKAQNGEELPMKVLARELIESKQAGGSLCLPAGKKDPLGQEGWRYEPPTTQAPPACLMEIGASLDAEIFEGLGIPPELIQSSGGGGLGVSRDVPQEAFYSSLDQVVLCVAQPMVRMIENLVRWNFGEVPFTIVPTPILQVKAIMENGTLSGDPDEFQQTQDMQAEQALQAQEAQNNPNPSSPEKKTAKPKSSSGEKKGKSSKTAKKEGSK